MGSRVGMPAAWLLQQAIQQHLLPLQLVDHSSSAWAAACGHTTYTCKHTCKTRAHAHECTQTHARDRTCSCCRMAASRRHRKLQQHAVSQHWVADVEPTCKSMAPNRESRDASELCAACVQVGQGERFQASYFRFKLANKVAACICQQLSLPKQPRTSKLNWYPRHTSCAGSSPWAMMMAV